MRYGSAGVPLPPANGVPAAAAAGQDDVAPPSLGGVASGAPASPSPKLTETPAAPQWCSVSETGTTMPATIVVGTSSPHHVGVAVAGSSCEQAAAYAVAENVALPTRSAPSANAALWPGVTSNRRSTSLPAPLTCSRRHATS